MGSGPKGHNFPRARPFSRGGSRRIKEKTAKDDVCCTGVSTKKRDEVEENQKSSKHSILEADERPAYKDDKAESEYRKKPSSVLPMKASANRSKLPESLKEVNILQYMVEETGEG